MTAPVVVADNLTLDYRLGGSGLTRPRIIHALRGVSFSIERGTTLAVVGESGSGKSTLARILTLILPPTGGELRLDGQPIDIRKQRVTRELRRKVQLVFQNPYGSLNPRQRILSVLTEPLKLNTDAPPSERNDRAAEMIRRVGLTPDHLNRYPHMFSGGQRQRIAIARALMLNPELLILDEPVSALDLSVQAQILNLLADLQDEFRLTYVFVSHNLAVVRHVADDVIVMLLGEIVERGKTGALFEDPRHEYTRALLAATPRADVEHIRARIAARIPVVSS
ncbi:MAG: ATP-binding cassette domain-containing protein [Bauldia sp.]|nr:ATP-binding cassette domain-containing protein [Bauldia sp.]